MRRQALAVNAEDRGIRVFLWGVRVIVVCVLLLGAMLLNLKGVL